MHEDPFVHLRVASGYSLRYGASHPHVLVERAAEQGMDTLALTDRDGVYGAVKFVTACQQAGIRPVLGVDLAYDSPGRRGRDERWSGGERWSDGHARPPRTPVRGGTFRDDRLPRVTLLASGRAGWAALCRLVSATHLAGERGKPVTTPELIAEHLGGGDVLVMLGPDSTLGELVRRRRDDLAQAMLERWRTLVPSENLLVELVSHRLPGGSGGWGPGTSPLAARMAGVAREARLEVVLTNAVRYADRLDAPVVDVLDASRRLVPLDPRHLDRGNAEGFLKSGKQMHEVAEEICRLAGLGTDTEREARALLARTRVVADRCALDPRSDLGVGEVHFPEFSVVGAGGDVDAALRARCEGAIGDRYGSAPRQVIWKRLDDELEMIRGLGYASYFLTVAEVTDLIRGMGVRVAARGSGAGSLVNHLLGVSGVDPLRHGLLMERFLSPSRTDLPDIDIDVESARRLEVYGAILDRFGGERCVCVSMMDTYRVRHAVRDVGAALGMPPGEIDAIAKAFPHIRARDARAALRDLPELRASRLGEGSLDLLFRLAERLDGLPRHIAVHPCGVLLSDATLLDRTPVEASYAGFPMSQFDKDDVEALGLLKLDVLGIRMQSAMAHAVAEISRVDGVDVDLDDQRQVPFDDPATYDLISSARTLGMFQIESPGQRELVGKSGIESFEDVITDISLFRPGPVKSDMVTPYLEAKQGWRPASYLHPDLRPILEGTHGVVVFHEQVIEIIAQVAGVTNEEADEKRRALGSPDGMADTKLWFFPRALGRGYPLPLVEQVWSVLAAFASFGFCKAHAAAFALPTFQSAWLKTHWPAHFLAGVLTHDPGMYPKRLLLEDARQFGVTVLGLDVNASGKEYAVERLHDDNAAGGRPGGAYGIRLALSEVKGISEAEVARIVAARDDCPGAGLDAEAGAGPAAPYVSLADFWQRAQVSRPVVERLVLTGGFDAIHHIGSGHGVPRRGRLTRRDLLLQVAELDRRDRSLARATGRARGLGRGAGRGRAPLLSSPMLGGPTDGPAVDSVWARASAQSRASRSPAPVDSVQLTLDLDDPEHDGTASGLPEMDAVERMGAELEILGLDVSQHVVHRYADFLDALGATRSTDLLRRRSRAELFVGGVKVATQTPPIRSGRRVVFLTLDDGTGPVDATFFEDAQGPWAATVFGSWLLLVRGELRRTGRRGVSLRATGCWELPALHALWQAEGMAAVRTHLATPPPGFGPNAASIDEEAVVGAAASRSTRPVMAPVRGGTAGGMGHRRVLVHSSGFKVSPYADVKPAGESAKQVPRTLWHRSPGSPG